MRDHKPIVAYDDNDKPIYLKTTPWYEIFRLNQLYTAWKREA